MKLTDFEIIKEPWNKYHLGDNSILKIRTILKKIERTIKGDKTSFTMDAQTLTVIYAESSLKGTPNKQKITEKDIIKSIDIPNLRYNTMTQEFSKYCLDDGTKINIFTLITNISRTILKDHIGDPIYSIKSTNMVEVN